MSGQYLSTSKYFITRGKCVPSHRLLTLFIRCVFVRLVCFVSSKTANSILWIPVLDLKVLTKFYCNFSKCLSLDADQLFYFLNWSKIHYDNQNRFWTRHFENFQFNWIESHEKWQDNLWWDDDQELLLIWTDWNPRVSDTF